MESSVIVSAPTVEQLCHVASHYPIIDNHAHNLILPTHADTIPFEAITTEAQGRALRDTFKSLPHLRAENQLRQLYECGPEADWEDIVNQRTEWIRADADRLHRRCFEGVHAVLIDDGFAASEKVYPYDYHDRFTTAATRRIVRIEAVAERLMENMLQHVTEDSLAKSKFLPDTWLTFTEEFEREIEEAIKNHRVAGFKTVIAYRTGLDIEYEYEKAARDVGHPFERYVKSCIRNRSYRIEKKALNDYLVLRTLEILSDSVPHSDTFSKPLQFHTGVGDNDINLLESNPAYMQPLIENYPMVPFVLLHAAYPYTREAGYLATVYRHVYLDVGEVFPIVSKDGQRAVLRQAMELTPGSKLLYSSDGHWFSETFWLANRQFREVMTEHVKSGHLTAHQAIAMTKDILFANANALYKLGYEAVFDETVPDAPRQLTFNPKSPAQPPYPGTPTAPSQEIGAENRTATAQSFDAVLPPPPPPPAAVVSTEDGSHVYDMRIFNEFQAQNPDIRFVYVQWLDSMAIVRARILPIKEFTRKVRQGERIGMSQASTGLLQNDTITPLVNTTGQIYIEPDLRSLRCSHNKDPIRSATVLSYWRDGSGKPTRECPRHNLENLINTLQSTHSTTMLVGFEIEVFFLSRQADESSQAQSLVPLTRTHAWSTLTPEQWLQLPFLSEIVLGLEGMGIEVQQFHAESGQGQYEFVLPPSPPLLAVDVLIQARQVIAQIASLHGLRATLHPKPFRGVGTGAHTHMSVHPADGAMAFFVGGVLAHLPAICAISMPEAESYERLGDDQWSGGTWVAWGTQNRETPLRRVSQGRWEMRCVDGFANMYYTLSAVLAAGMLGLRAAATGQPVDYRHKDVPVNPSTLDEAGRAEYGIVQKMPAGLGEAMAALQNDELLSGALPPGFVADYVVMKESEGRMLEAMGAAERRAFLMERY